MPDVFDSFLENPTGESFRAMREMLLQQPEYDFQSKALAEVEDLAAEEEFEDVLDRGAEAMPEWLLSPSMHQYLADAAMETGDEDRARSEEYLMKACLRGLAQSGDGTPEQPYLVMHPADEYDLVESLGKEAASQSKAQTGQRSLDRIRCSDGTDLYFDITEGTAQGAARANTGIA